MADFDEDDLELTPVGNPDLVGHEPAETILASAFHKGTLAHAWLLNGPEGIGKATLAYRFARFVLAAGDGSPRADDTGPSLFGDTPDGSMNDDLGKNDSHPDQSPLHIDEDHPVFRRILAGSHSDLMVIEPETDAKTGRRSRQIVVDSVRNAKQFLSRTAGEGAWRVVIVDSADQLNRNAANALLKVLEEPPARVLFLLVCHRPGRILPTIRSRCRSLVLRPPVFETTLSYLRSRGISQSDEEIRRIFEMTRGAIGRALDLSDDTQAEIMDTVISTMSQSADGVPVDRLHKFADDLSRAGHEAKFDLFAQVFRWNLETAIRWKSTGAGGRPMPAINEAFAESLDLDQGIKVWENVTRLFESVSTANLDRKQVVLNAFFSLEDAVSRAEPRLR